MNLSTVIGVTTGTIASRVSAGAVVTPARITIAPPSVSDFTRGFALSASPIISPATTSGGQEQVQELFRFRINETTDRVFWSEWDNGTATPSRIRTALSLRATPTVFTDIAIAVTGEAAAAATTTGDPGEEVVGLDYLRMGGADYDGTTFRLFLNGSGRVYVASGTNGTTFTINATPVTPEGGHLLATLRDGADLFGVYAIDGGTAAAQYFPAKFVSGSWVTIGTGAILSSGAPGSPDAGGMEHHFLFLYAGRIGMLYEGYSGASGSPANRWTAQFCYSAPIVGGNVEAALVGTWTKLGVVAQRDAATSWGQVHIATPTYFDGRFYCQGSNIGDDSGEPVQGNPGRWDIGTGLLNPA